jgi:hypothetical protein
MNGKQQIVEEVLDEPKNSQLNLLSGVAVYRPPDYIGWTRFQPM